jgi:hypothetical protein
MIHSAPHLCIMAMPQCVLLTVVSFYQGPVLAPASFVCPTRSCSTHVYCSSGRFVSVAMAAGHTLAIRLCLWWRLVVTDTIGMLHVYNNV